MFKTESGIAKRSLRKEHGKGLAHVVTAGRVPLTFEAARLTLQENGGLRSVATNGLTDASDIVDGWLARGQDSSNQPYSIIGPPLDLVATTFDGSSGDRNVDHFSQNVRRAALMLVGLVHPADVAIPMLRDKVVDSITDGRKSDSKEGTASPSTLAGQVKTWIMAFSFLYSATKHAREHPMYSKRLHRLGTVASVTSGVITVFDEKLKKKHSKAVRVCNDSVPCEDTLEAASH